MTTFKNFCPQFVFTLIQNGGSNHLLFLHRFFGLLVVRLKFKLVLCPLYFSFTWWTGFAFSNSFSQQENLNSPPSFLVFD